MRADRILTAVLLPALSECDWLTSSQTFYITNIFELICNRFFPAMLAYHSFGSVSGRKKSGGAC